MENRRDFIKRAAAASGSAGIAFMLPESVQKALAIDPPKGSTFLDAEHVVILMQENRSFDHCYGMLRGVRGFNDPRAIHLPDGNPVWCQTNAEGATYVPFRLNLVDTKATWMGSLPHTWTNQVDARNDGAMDKWLEVKKSGQPPLAKMPLTLGYYDRRDLPFYYAMADAFTICDQAFCSSLTGTTPNRLYLWSGTIRDEQTDESKARVFNEDTDYDTEASWKTFPETLEEFGVSWKVYQNEISAGVGLSQEEEEWLANFGDNPLEYFTQYRVRFLPAYIKNLPGKIVKLTAAIEAMQAQADKSSPADQQALLNKRAEMQSRLQAAKEEEIKYTAAKYQSLLQREKSLHEKAFVTNRNDPDYHRLDSIASQSNTDTEKLVIPKGDVLFEFRNDVKTGKLPAVSWLVAPENLSDHPSAPWYGAAYISEVIDILTKDQETWKKTIFILAYDENDGYFDHMPPFVPPHSGKPETGKMSDDIDTTVDYVTLEKDQKWRPAEKLRESPIGLGFRVPLLVASPWSRGGVVNSQVFDHTSVLQFLEKFLSHKTGKTIVESNISPWRRVVCGDLTSVFKPYNGQATNLPAFIKAKEFYRTIFAAKENGLPGAFQSLTASQLEKAKQNSLPMLPHQEEGIRTSSGLPYQFYADSILSDDKASVKITFQASNKLFGTRSAGAPFLVYARGLSHPRGSWSFGVKAGSNIVDSWQLGSFEDKRYHLLIYGPNGFFRELKGSAIDPPLSVSVEYEMSGGKPSGNLVVNVVNKGSDWIRFELVDLSYKAPSVTTKLAALGSSELIVNLSKSFSWYDLRFRVNDFPDFEKRFAGRVETDRSGFSDPAMSGVDSH